MKKQLYATFLLGLSFFTGSAQSKKLEIGLTGGIHLHNHRTYSGLTPKNRLGTDIAGSLFVRYAINPKFKIGIALLVSEWKTKASSGGYLGSDDVTVYEASPMLGMNATLTTVLYDFKSWQVSFLIRGGFARAIKAKVPPGNTPPYTEYALPNANGFNLGMHLEVSRMLNHSIGIQGSIGADAYSVSLDETYSSYNSRTDLLLSCPVELGVFARL